MGSKSHALLPLLHTCGEGALGTNVALQFRGGEVGHATVQRQLSLKLSGFERCYGEAVSAAFGVLDIWAIALN